MEIKEATQVVGEASEEEIEMVASLLEHDGTHGYLAAAALTLILHGRDKSTYKAILKYTDAKEWSTSHVMNLRALAGEPAEEEG